MTRPAVPLPCLLTNRAVMTVPGIGGDSRFVPVQDDQELHASRVLLDLHRSTSVEYGLHRILPAMLAHPLVFERLGLSVASVQPLAFDRPSDILIGGRLVPARGALPVIDRVADEFPVQFEMRLTRLQDGAAAFEYMQRRVVVAIDEEPGARMVHVEWPEDSGISGSILVDDWATWANGTLTVFVNHVPAIRYGKWVRAVILDDPLQVHHLNKWQPPLQLLAQREGLHEAMLQARSFRDGLAIAGLALALSTWRLVEARSGRSAA